MLCSVEINLKRFIAVSFGSCMSIDPKWTKLPRPDRFGQILIWFKRHHRLFINYTSCYSFLGTHPGLSPNVGCSKGAGEDVTMTNKQEKPEKDPAFPVC